MNDKKLLMDVRKDRLTRIAEVLNNINTHSKGEKKIKPDWDKELQYILEGAGGPTASYNLVSDVFAENEETGEKYAFELSSITKQRPKQVSKEKILKLYAMQPRIINRCILCFTL